MASAADTMSHIVLNTPECGNFFTVPLLRLAGHTRKLRLDVAAVHPRLRLVVLVEHGSVGLKGLL